MKILLLWLGLICCGVANGLIYDCVKTPVSYCYIGIVSVCALSMLVIHRHYTKSWCKRKEEKESDYPLVFVGTAAISVLVGVESILVMRSEGGSCGFFIGCLTVFIASCIAAMREKSYA